MLELAQLRVPWWHHDAACKDADTDLFFIDRGRTSKAAKAYCAECPVSGECLDWSLSQSETVFGVWGGMTLVERKAEKRRWRRVEAA